jgi:hypothetical protein
MAVLNRANSVVLIILTQIKLISYVKSVNLLIICNTVLPRLSEVFWDNLTEIHIIENSLNRINEYDTKRKNDKSFSVLVRSNVFTRVIFFFQLNIIGAM